MTGNDDKTADDMTPQEQLAAMLALLADNNPPMGVAPDLKEIQDWQAGKLDAQRAAEVKTHIARNPECYKMWSELQAASDLEPQYQKLPSVINKLWQWLKQVWSNPVLLGSGGMVTALLVIVVIVFFPQDKSVWQPGSDPIYATPEFDWPYLAMSTTRGGEINYRYKRAFQTGLRNGLKLTTQAQDGWNVAIDALPETLPSCGKSKNVKQCEKQNKSLQKIGVYAGVLYLACLEKQKISNKTTEQAQFSDNFWQSQQTAWNMLTDELHKAEITVFDAELNKLKTGDAGQQCSAARDLIYKSY